MNDSYNKSVRLQCATCGGESFTFDDDKTHIKCDLCNREYVGGYDELKECNQELIDTEIEMANNEIIRDLQKEIADMFKKAFK